MGSGQVYIIVVHVYADSFPACHQVQLRCRAGQTLQASIYIGPVKVGVKSPELAVLELGNVRIGQDRIYAAIDSLAFVPFLGVLLDYQEGSSSHPYCLVEFSR